MRGDEGDEAEVRAGVGRLEFFDGAGGEPGFAGQGGGHGAELRHVIHVAAFAVDLLDVRKAGRAGAEPGDVIVGEKFLFGGPEFFGVFVGLETEGFVARLGVEFPEAPGAVAARGEGGREVGPAALGDAVAGSPVAQPTRLRGLAAGHEGVAGRHADGARGVGVRARDAALDETVEVRRVGLGVAKACDGVEPLLVRHYEENVGRRRGRHRWEEG